MEYFKSLYVLIFVLSTYVPINTNQTQFSNIIAEKSISKTNSAFYSLNINKLKAPNFESFSKAVDGYNLLKQAGKIKNNILTIVDFSLSSSQKRLWVIDMNQNKILFNSLVAHGQNSGEEYATFFSNENSSYKSSLGFFSTAEVYQGIHGLSLKLDGLEKGINDKARQRSIVIHGADYVSESFIKNHNRLGRSQGCPALPVELSKQIIETIKNKSCLFIYAPNENYNSRTKLVS